jgi:hypothetical protein
MENSATAGALQPWRGDAFPFYHDFFVIEVEQNVL